MRALRLGVGSVREVTACAMAAEPEVTGIVLADIGELSPPAAWPHPFRIGKSAHILPTRRLAMTGNDGLHGFESGRCS